MASVSGHLGAGCGPHSETAFHLHCSPDKWTPGHRTPVLSVGGPMPPATANSPQRAGCDFAGRGGVVVRRPAPVSLPTGGTPCRRCAVSM